MPLTVSSYSINHPAAFEGQLASASRATKISAMNKTGNIIPFGVAVFFDADDAQLGKTRSAALPSSSSELKNFCGVVLREVVNAFADDEEFGARPNRVFTALNDGEVYVKPLEDVAAGGDVFVRVAGDDLGKLCASAGSGETLSKKIPNAIWITSATAGQLAVAQFNRHGGQ